jgi:hypothetical protein
MVQIFQKQKGDKIGIVADPSFNDAPNGDFTTKAASPARKAASQTLPSGYEVATDCTSFVFCPAVNLHFLIGICFVSDNKEFLHLITFFI